MTDVAVVCAESVDERPQLQYSFGESEPCAEVAPPQEYISGCDGLEAFSSSSTHATCAEESPDSASGDHLCIRLVARPLDESGSDAQAPHPPLVIDEEAAAVLLEGEGAKQLQLALATYLSPSFLAQAHATPSHARGAILAQQLLCMMDSHLTVYLPQLLEISSIRAYIPTRCNRNAQLMALREAVLKVSTLTVRSDLPMPSVEGDDDLASCMRVRVGPSSHAHPCARCTLLISHEDGNERALLTQRNLTLAQVQAALCGMPVLHFGHSETSSFSLHNREAAFVVFADRTTAKKAFALLQGTTLGDGIRVLMGVEVNRGNGTTFCSIKPPSSNGSLHPSERVSTEDCHSSSYASRVPRNVVSTPSPLCCPQAIGADYMSGGSCLGLPSLDTDVRPSGEIPWLRPPLSIDAAVEVVVPACETPYAGRCHNYTPAPLHPGYARPALTTSSDSVCVPERTHIGLPPQVISPLFSVDDDSMIVPATDTAGNGRAREPSLWTQNGLTRRPFIDGEMIGVKDSFSAVGGSVSCSRYSPTCIPALNPEAPPFETAGWKDSELQSATSQVKTDFPLHHGRYTSFDVARCNSSRHLYRNNPYMMMRVVPLKSVNGPPSPGMDDSGSANCSPSASSFAPSAVDNL